MNESQETCGSSFLEDTLSISEGGDVSGGVLLVHGLSGELLSNHVSEDTHHSGTSVVDLNIQLAGLLLGVLDVGSEVTNSVVSIVLGSRHPGQLNKSEEGKDLGKSGSGDGADSVSSGGNIRELQVVGGGKVSATLYGGEKFVSTLFVLTLGLLRLFRLRSL